MTKRLSIVLFALLSPCSRPLVLPGDGGTLGAPERGAHDSGGFVVDAGAGEGGGAGGAPIGGSGGVGTTGGATGAGGGGTGGRSGGSMCGDLTVVCPTETHFCESPPGDCGKMLIAGASCVERPTGVCTTEFDPRCGCDGKTYGSDCERQQAGVSLAALGACDGTGAPCQSGGGSTSSTCRANLFCDIPAGACNNDALSPGVCVARPASCDTVHQPVCGCDGNSYSNDCERVAAGVHKLSNGACYRPTCPPAPPAAGAACVRAYDSCVYQLETGCSVGFICSYTKHWLPGATVCPQP